MSKTILILSPFFYPEPISTGKYNTFLAKAIVKNGKQVCIGCSHPLYPNWIPKVSNEFLHNVRIYRGGGWLRYPKSAMLRRLLLEVWFAFHASRVSFRVRKEIDSVVAIFPPSLFFMFVHLILPRGVRRIGIVHDLQGVLGLSCGGIFKRFFNHIVTVVERAGFSSCDRVILLSEGMRRHVLEAYNIMPEKCLVRHPFLTDEPDYSNVGRKLESIFPTGYSHVVYSGALGDKQAPENLLNLFQFLVSYRRDVMCHIFSRGPLFNHLRSLWDSETMGRIVFHDLVDEKDLPELFARSSIQVIPQKTGTSDGAFPSKLPNLLAAGVPVFAITDVGSELSKILKESGIGECHFNWEYRDIVPRLSDFIDRMNVQTHLERILSTRTFVYKNFHVDSLIADLELA